MKVAGEPACVRGWGYGRDAETSMSDSWRVPGKMMGWGKAGDGGETDGTNDKIHGERGERKRMRENMGDFARTRMDKLELYKNYGSNKERKDP